MSLSRRHLAAALALAFLPAAAHASGGGAEKKKGGGASFIQLAMLTSTVVRGDGRRGVLTVETGLDIADGKLREAAQLAQPRLRAAFVQVLQTYATGLAPDSPPNPDVIGFQLQRATDRVLGKPGAKLLLGAILVN